jgi:oxaloacetate decarboxylase alpha subunit
VRAECGWPPLGSPIGNIIGSQALLHVLSAQRWQAVVDEVRLLVSGRYGTPPRPIDPVVARAVALLAAGEGPERSIDLDELRESAAGLAASEEELLLLALFGEEAEPLLRTIRARARGEEPLAAVGLEGSRTERVRELIEIVQESGIGEVTIEEGDLRVTVRRTEEAQGPQETPGPAVPEPEPAPEPAGNGLVRVSSPMVGVFYRAADPDAAPFVEVGDAVAAGQTLCLLEAMKLFNEVKAEIDAVVRAICVDNAQPVEYGQLLFELEPIDGRPLDALA